MLKQINSLPQNKAYKSFNQCNRQKIQTSRCHRSFSRQQIKLNALDPDNSSVLVIGGKGVAFETVKKLKDMGSWVWMMRRNANQKADIEAQQAIWVQGDAMDTQSLEKVFSSIEEIDAVVSTLQGDFPNGQTTDSIGNINLIEKALQKGVKKYVLITSLGCGDSRDAVDQKTYDVLKPYLDEKNKAEKKLQESGSQMPYTIIRPGGLTNGEETDEAFLTEDKLSAGKISRITVAKLISKALFNEKTDNKVLTALEKAGARMGPNATEFQL